MPTNQQNGHTEKPVLAFWENRGTAVFDDEAPNGQIIGYNDVTTGSAIFPNAEAAYDNFDPETMNRLSVKALEDLPPVLAAAPELLEALKFMVRDIKCCGHDVEIYKTAMNRAFAAIAKAEKG